MASQCDSVDNSNQLPPGKNWLGWRHFSWDHEKMKASCKLCSDQLNGAYSTNLKQHLRTKHPIEFSKLVEHLNEQPTRQEKITMKRKLDYSKRKNKRAKVTIPIDPIKSRFI